MGTEEYEIWQRLIFNGEVVKKAMETKKYVPFSNNNILTNHTHNHLIPNQTKSVLW